MINTFSSAGSDDRCHISSPCRVGRERTGAKSPTPTDGGCMVRPVGTATSREKRVRPRVRSISAPSRGPSRCATRWRRAYAAPVESAAALTADSDDDEETLERSTPQLFTTSRHALCDTFDRTSRLCRLHSCSGACAATATCGPASAAHRCTWRRHRCRVTGNHGTDLNGPKRLAPRPLNDLNATLDTPKCVRR